LSLNFLFFIPGWLAIVAIFFILISNYFILFLFNIYLEVKKYSQILHDINFIYNLDINKKSKFKFTNLQTIQTRNFSTSSLNKNNNTTELGYDPAIDTLTNDQLIELFETDPEFHKKHQDHHRAKAVMKFKKIYKGGFLGYNQIHHFGNISNFIKEFDSGDVEYLTSKFKDFLYEIPENKIYSVLPVLRWQYLNGEYNSISITKSTKITRDTSWQLLSKKIILEIKEALSIYELSGLDIDFFMMGRPWLSADDFDIEK
jgi:hypothetical protein